MEAYVMIVRYLYGVVKAYAIFVGMYLIIYLSYHQENQISFAN